MSLSPSTAVNDDQALTSRPLGNPSTINGRWVKYFADQTVSFSYEPGLNSVFTLEYQNLSTEDAAREGVLFSVDNVPKNLIELSLSESGNMEAEEADQTDAKPKLDDTEKTDDSEVVEL